MDLVITARHFKPSSQLSELVNEKVSKVSKFTYDITRCEVILTKENSYKNVEIIGHVKGHDLIVNDSSEKFEHLKHLRKPNIGMLEAACKKWPVIKEMSLIIGDKEVDMLCAKNFGIKGFLFKESNLLKFIEKNNII